MKLGECQLEEIASSAGTTLEVEQVGLLPVRASLKWFNAPKGFGFVNPKDEQDVDAFLHITTLQKAGVQAVGEGAEFICLIDRCEKGALVTEVVEVLDCGDITSVDALGCEDDYDGETYEMQGTVKWYRLDKGFGFVVPDDGKKDVFVHQTCLERAGIKALETGQKIMMKFKSVPKGRELVSFSVLDQKFLAVRRLLFLLFFSQIFIL